MTGRPARATQIDITRALKAAREAGECMAVEILPNGTIRLRPAEKLAENTRQVDEEEVVRLC